MVSEKAKKGGLLTTGVGLVAVGLELIRSGNHSVGIIVTVLGLAVIFASEYWGIKK